MSKPKITSVEISPMPRPMPQGMFDPMPSVTATFDDGSKEKLFTFYPDELSFTEGEFIGLTADKAHHLRHKRDVAYLQGGEER